MNLIRLCAVVLLLGASACARVVETEQDAFYREKMVRHMEGGARWIVTNGIPVFLAQGEQSMKRSLREAWPGVQSWAQPAVNTERFIAQFRIKARGIFYDIHALAREAIDGQVVEIWVAKISGDRYSGESRRCLFFVTASPSIEAERVIVAESDQVIESHAFGDSGIELPVDDLRVLYDLEAWEFPDCYRQSRLDEVIIRIDRDGSYVVAK